MKNHGFLRRRAFIFIALIFLAFFFPGFLSAQRASNPVDIPVGASPIWDQELGDLVMDRPYLQAESVVVVGAGGAVQSFYMTGTPLWEFSPESEVGPHIGRSVEGAAYFSDSAGNFRAVNRVGRELWRVNLGSTISFPPVVGWDGRVFIPVGSVISCRTASGNPLWTIDLGSTMIVAPMLDRAGSFVTVLENMDFVRVSQFSSVERIRLDRMPLLTVSLKSSTQDCYILLYPSGATEKIIYNEGAARGSRLSKGSFISLPMPPASAASASLSTDRGDLFAVTLRDGRVQLISESGQVLWTANSHETAEERGSANLDHSKAAMVFDDRGIYSISTRGATGFALDGRRRLILRIAEASTVPAFSDEGLLYVCGMDKVLYNYKLDNKPRNVARSRYYGPEPEGSYGMGNPPRSPWFSDSTRFEPANQDIMYARIESAITSGQIGENEPAYVAYLMEMIGFFLNDPHYSRVRPSVNPVRHVEYIKLLGRVGSRETIPFLWNIFDRYHEPAIKSACAEAIGDIGVDPHGSTFESYNFLLAANNPNRDPQLLMSASASIAALSRFSGPPLSGDGILLLRYFTNLTWAPNAIRNYIRQELDDLYREGLDRGIR